MRHRTKEHRVLLCLVNIKFWGRLLKSRITLAAFTLQWFFCPYLAKMWAVYIHCIFIGLALLKSRSTNMDFPPILFFVVSFFISISFFISFYLFLCLLFLLCHKINLIVLITTSSCGRLTFVNSLLYVAIPLNHTTRFSCTFTSKLDVNFEWYCKLQEKLHHACQFFSNIYADMHACL